MGGTSADIGLVRDGEIQYVPDFELEFGLPIATPAIDLRHARRRAAARSRGSTTAACCASGRGARAPSRARPATGSAEPSRPSPTRTSCSAGSTRARSSDGCLQLDPGRAHDALAALGARVGLDAVAAAEAVIEIANEGMAGTIRRVAVERGVDPRDFELVAFGGAGPLHAAEIAASLGMAGVIVPPHPGLASAFGTLLADRRVDRRSTHYSRSDAVDVRALAERLETMELEARTALAEEGFAGEPAVARSLSMRYAGQNYERECRSRRGRSTSTGSPMRSPRSTRCITMSTATASPARRSS